MLKSIIRSNRADSFLVSILLLSGISGLTISIIPSLFGIGTAAAFGLILLVVVWLVLVRHFEVALALSLVGLPFYIFIFDALGVETSSATTFFFYLSLISSGLVGVVKSNASRVKSVIGKPTTLWLLSFLIWMVLSWLLMTRDIREAQEKIVFGFLRMLFTYVAISSFTSKNLRKFIIAALVMGGVLLLLSLRAFLVGGSSISGRFSFHENVSALVLAYDLGVVCVLGFVWASLTRGRYMLPMNLGLALLFFVMVLSNSRGPLLASAVSIVSVSLLVFRVRKAKILFLLVVLAIVLSALFSLVPSLDLRRYERVSLLVSTWWESGEIDEELLRSATSGRTDIWRTSVQRWASSPIIGVGLGDYGNTKFAHNFVLETLLELGVIGLCILLGFFGGTISQLRAELRNPSDRWLAFSTVGLFVFAVVHASLSGRVQTVADVWVATGMINALSIEKHRRIWALTPCEFLQHGKTDQVTAV
jgi:O-antigen ligase